MNLFYNQDKIETRTESHSPGMCISEKCEQTQIEDVNGDGLSDFVSFDEKSNVYVIYNSYSGWLKLEEPNKIKVYNNYKWENSFASEWDKQKNRIQLADMNNDKLPDLVLFWKDGVYVALNQYGDKFDKQTRWLAAFGSNDFDVNYDFRTLSDLNNDGLPDLVYFSDNGLQVAMNIGGLKFDNPILISSQTKSKENTNAYSYSPSIADLNADGKLDFILIKNLKTLNKVDSNAFWISDMLRANNVYMFLNISSEFYGQSSSVSRSDYWDPAYHIRSFTDLNQDNLPDLVAFKTSQLKTATNEIKGYTFEITNSQSYAFSQYSHDSLDKKFRSLVDFNSDGLVDVVLFRCEGVYVLYNAGTKFLDAQLLTDTIKSCSSEYAVRNPRLVHDVDGDGRMDLVSIDDEATFTIVYGEHSSRLKLTSLVDSFDTGVRIVYTNLIENNQMYSIDSLSSRKTQQDAHFSAGYTLFGTNRKQVVQSIDKSWSMHFNGFEKNVVTTSYLYGAYACPTQLGRSCEFTFIEINEKNSPIRTRTEFFQHFPLGGLTRFEKKFYKDTLIERKSNGFRSASLSTSTPFDSLSIYTISLDASRTDYFYHDHGAFIYSQELNYKYDAYSNMISIDQVTRDSDGETCLIRNRTFTYLIDAAEWFLNQLVHSEDVYMLNYDARNSRRKAYDYTYDIQSRNVAEKSFLAEEKNLALREIYTYDQYGNTIELAKIPQDKKQDSRVEKFVYDKLGVNKIGYTNPVGHTESYYFDYEDNLYKKVDSNYNHAEYKYDELGRKVWEHSPDGSTVSYSYEWHSSVRNYTNKDIIPVVSVYKVTSWSSNGHLETIIHDGQKRVVRLITKDNNGDDVYEDICHYIPGLNSFKLNSLKYRYFFKV